MLKHIRVLRDPDVKPEGGGSSPTPETTPAGSSPETSAPAAPAASAAAPEPTVESVVADALKAHQPEAKSDEASDALPQSKTEEKPAGAEEPPAKVEEDKGPIPYDRFKEVNDKARTFEQELAAAKPLADAARTTQAFLDQHGITAEEHQDALETLALIRTNPAAGLAKLKPLMAALAPYDDSALPAETATKIAGLAKRVEDGDLSKADAAELETMYRSQAKFEAQQRLGTKQNELTAAQRQQQYVQSMTNSASQWSNAKMASDPDYKPKSKADEPDGLFELTKKGFMYEVSQTPVKTPQDVAKLLEKAYEDGKRTLNRFKPAPTKPSPNSTRSSSQQHAEPKNEEEVVASVMRQHGLAYTPRGVAA